MGEVPTDNPSPEKIARRLAWFDEYTARLDGQISVCLCPVLRPRRDRSHPAMHGVRRGLPRLVISGLNSTASTLAVFASPPGLPQGDA